MSTANMEDYYKSVVPWEFTISPVVLLRHINRLIAIRKELLSPPKEALAQDYIAKHEGALEALEDLKGKMFGMFGIATSDGELKGDFCEKAKGVMQELRDNDVFKGIQ